MSGLGVVLVALRGGAALAAARAALRAEGIADADVAVEPDADLDVPLRRGRGLRRLQTPLALVLEDTVTLRPGWRAAAAAFDEDPFLIGVSGRLTPSPTLTRRDLALLLADYGPVLGGAPDREVFALPGHAMLLRRTAIESLLQAGPPLHEDAIGALARRSGGRLRLLPALEARFDGPGDAQAALGTIARQARGWAGRQRGQEPLRSGGRAALAPLVAGLRAARALRQARRAGLLSALGPTGAAWTGAYAAAWALGESWGAALGPGQDGA